MTAGPTILSTRDGNVVTITLCQPAKLNAMTAEMWRSLKQEFLSIDADETLRAIILRGAGDRAFCVGADISEFGVVRDNRDAALAYGALCHEATASIQSCRHPVIALINGVCVGGGLELAAACDVRLASAGSRFGVPVKRLGLPADPSELLLFLRLMSPSALMDLLLDGRLIDTAEALRLGLVNHVFDRDEWEQGYQTYIQSVADGAPLVARAHKKMIYALASKSVANQKSDISDFASFDLFDSEDYAIGRAAFASKSKPQFVGR